MLIFQGVVGQIKLKHFIFIVLWLRKWGDGIILPSSFRDTQHKPLFLNPVMNKNQDLEKCQAF